MTPIPRRRLTRLTRLTRLLSTLAAAALVGCVAFNAPSTPTPPIASTTPPAADGAATPTGPAATGTPPPPAALPPGVDPAELPPPMPREFRAAWVATVANIDWPSKPGLPAEVQRAEALALLDRAQSLGLNALILQVRPAGDALYPSALEPWSEYLTGEQGKPPQPPYDPLAFWVQEAHRRALELHVWFNPYRARHSSAKTPQVAPHLAVRQPALVKRYGEQQWMDPGEPAAAAHTLAVVSDVVRRYDIDGVHIDDYFYPYPVSVPPQGGVEVPFPDEESYARYRLGGGQQLRDDWRRANVDSLVQQLYTTVHQIKPWVRVGISPFGLGRPDRRPPGVGGPIGFSQYDKLYADVERWFAAGWMDYLAPQLYWQINREGLQFPVLLDLWVAENTQRRHLWPGLFTSLVTRGEPLGPRAWPAREIAEQIALQRQRGERAGGHIHFSMVALMQNRDGLATLLQNGAYAQPALVPATPWLDDQAPPAPTLRRSGNRVAIEPAAGEAASRWAVWRRVGGNWRFAVLPGAERSLDAAGADRVAVSAVDRVGNTSAQHVLVLP
jgi:uncharacterized lipoprotein YddW (UPF0748 family)